MQYSSREYIRLTSETLLIPPSNLKPYITTEIHIISLSDYSGPPAQPTTGTYTVYIQLVPDGSFHSISDLGGVLDATLTSGDLLPDGQGLYLISQSIPHSIKIVPNIVDVATHYRVTIKQKDN